MVLPGSPVVQDGLILPVLILGIGGTALLLAIFVWIPAEIGRIAGYGLWHALRGDARWLFRPSADGRYHWIVSGRRSLGRSDAEGGGAIGTATRWFYLLALWVGSLTPLLLILEAVWRARG